MKPLRMAIGVVVVVLGISAIVAFAWYGGIGSRSGDVAALQGATEAEVIAMLGQPDLVLTSQAELRVLTFCYKSLQYEWVAGGSPRKGWMAAGQLPPIGQQAYWYEQNVPEYLIYFDEGTVSHVFKAGT